MEIKILNSKILMTSKVTFNNGINFVITEEKVFQENIMKKMKGKNPKRKVYIDGSLFPDKKLKKVIYFVNHHERKKIRKCMKFKRVVDTKSEVVRLLAIEDKVFDLQLRQLCHWSYLCSCAIGISKGKNILIFPWIDSKECSIQSYRLYKLSEYAKIRDLVIIVPTNGIEKFESNPNKCCMKYNVIR